MLQNLSALCMLGICSCEDIRKKEISGKALAFFLAEGILGCLLLWKFPPVSVLTALVPGFALWAGAYISKGAVGTGDGLLIMLLALFLPTETVYLLVFYALFFSAMYALFLFVVKKKGRDHPIPFVPFLLLGYLGAWLSSGGF